jgi:hypothetical protein
MKKALTTLACLLAVATVHAQSQKPGLWEITHKTGGNSEMDAAMAQMQKQMAGMSPEQRKQMEAMMGGNMPTAAAGGGMAMKVCLTPEMAARNEVPRQTEGDCTTTITSRSANGMKMNFVCTNPPSKGEGTYTFSGDKAYTAHMAIQSTRNGKPENTTIQGSGKWLSADCGKVKPFDTPKPAGK